MEADIRSRQGNSYGSARRRIAQSVASAIQMAETTSVSACSGNTDFCNDEAIMYDAHVCYLVANNSTVETDHKTFFSQRSSEHGSDSGSGSDSVNPFGCEYGFSTSESDLDTDSLCVSDDGPSLRVRLVEWAVNHNITHSALGSLLGILKPHHANLPADPRTLLKTPQTYVIEQIVGAQGQVGNYCHNQAACTKSRKSACTVRKALK
jgi:hypothetical protein